MTTNDLRWTDSYAETFSPHGYRSFTADGRRVADGKLADVLASVRHLASWQVYAVDSTGAVGSLIAEHVAGYNSLSAQVLRSVTRDQTPVWSPDRGWHDS